MTKRIISLILVVAMALLVLTGCSFNYAKKDLTKYATFDAQAFFEYLHNLNITDGDFTTDPATRENKVNDAIAAALLKVTDANEKKYEGTIGKYDSVYFCYYAVYTDENGEPAILYAEKMNAGSTTNFQVGLSTLSGLNKAISDKLLASENTVGEIKDYIYSTSYNTTVGNGDAVSVTYTMEWEENGESKSKIELNDYVVANENGNAFEKALIGMKVGDKLPEAVTVVTDDITYKYTYVKLESIVQDNSTTKAEEGDLVSVSYTMSFQLKADENDNWIIPDEFAEYDKDGNKTGATKVGTVDGNGKFTLTASYDTECVGKDTPTGENDTFKDEDKTFAGQLATLTVGSSTGSTITVKNVKFDGLDEAVDVTYSGVKVHWIFESQNEGFEVKYTPYEEELKDDKSNKKTAKDIYGNEVILNGVELTYYILPVYYLDVVDVNDDAAYAKVILSELATVVGATETKEHDHTAEDHEHETVYVFDTVQKNEFKNGDKTLVDLVTELVERYNTLTSKEKTLKEALTALTTAQSNLAKADSASTELVSLKTKLDNAHTTYSNAKVSCDEAELSLQETVTKILDAKNGDDTIADNLTDDYYSYQYDLLEDAYKADITEKLATKIIEYLQSSEIKFNDNLPKRAVKQAYKALMNEYKYDFYEMTYTTGVTNYSFYKGDFDAFLIDKVLSGNGDKKDVKEALMAQAEVTVQEIIVIYLLADVVEEKWDADVALTKSEKKELKKNIENTALLYKQYGISYSYNIDDIYHSEQFDKVMDYLLELSGVNEETLKVEFKNINYTTGSQNQ